MKCYAARVAAEDWFGYDLDVGRMRSEEELEVLAGTLVSSWISQRAGEAGAKKR